ncbi:MAG: carotenoid biosynthesis protein [Candidatus Limnocylindria bacterium]
MKPLYPILELGAAAFFVAAAWLALRRGRLPFLELVSAACFGLVLEEGDQLIFRTYHYAPDFALAIDRAPVAIGLTWALIIAGAMRITDALGVRRRYAPFVDSVLAIMLDLAFDAVAIRIGLWSWVGVGPHQGWFGVPAGNFYSWLLVTLGFTVLTRWLREGADARPGLAWLQLLVPIPAFVILIAAIVPFAVVRPLLDPAPGSGLGLFALTLAAFVALAAWGVWGPNRGVPDGQRTQIVDLRLAFLTRVVIELVFLGAMLAIGLALAEPVLLAVALALLAAEVPLAQLVRHRLRGAVAPQERTATAGSPALP